MTTIYTSYQDQFALDATHRAASFARGSEIAMKLLGGKGVKQAKQIASAVVDALTTSKGVSIDPHEFKRGFDACAKRIAEKRASNGLRDSASRRKSTSAEATYPDLIEDYWGA